MRLATLLAAIRRGWVCPIRRPRGGLPSGPGGAFSRPRPRASAILGSCVVLPEPVSPQTMMTWCCSSAAMISWRRPDTGSESGNSIGRRDGARGTGGGDLVENRRLSLSPSRLRRMSTVFNFTFVPLFRSVAPYIHKFRNQTFVVGVCGEAIAAGKLPNLAQDLAMIQSMGVKIVLVHGFRPQVNEQLRAKGHEARYSHGMRITDEVALDCAQEAAGQLRYEIEAAFSQGLPNTPMAGSTVRVISGNFITARPVGIVDGVDFQHSGLVRKVDVAGISRTLDMGALVLLSPFGFSPTGEAFNLTMEEVATSVAIALQADKLIFVTEVPGIRSSPTPRQAKTTRSTPSCRWPPPRHCLPSLPGAREPTDTRSTCSTVSRPARPGGAQPHHSVRGGRLAAAGGVCARRHRHHGDRRKAREPA
jgi:acetylglutamate kinase